MCKTDYMQACIVQDTLAKEVEFTLCYKHLQYNQNELDK